MNRCPLTYKEIPDEKRYSEAGLRSLDPKLRSLEDLPFNSVELVQEAARRVDKMSIAGVQPKVSGFLNVSAGRFELRDTGGRYIFKPATETFPEIPENEDLTMRLARVAGLETPAHGLVYMRDRSLCYVIRRFDRLTGRRKLATEDFAQLLGLDRETKYQGSMEKVAQVIDRFCTFPVLEKVKLFRRTIVAFLLGNEDMHLKNFSLVTTPKRIVQLSPVYDFVNSTIVLNPAREELALSLGGKKSRFTKEHLVSYYGSEWLQLSDAVVADVIGRIKNVQEEWRTLIDQSFLSREMKAAYKELVTERRSRLGLS